ncbi:MAG TPA: ABC transporter ATP-binding protein [Gemmataceae bacterium]|nr:ABC transporter ATP-binding protein [Gemmataceae bacterium]
MARRRSLQESLPGLRRILRHFWPLIRKQRLLITGSLAAMLAEVVLRILEPWPLKFIFDHVLRLHGGARRAGSFLDDLNPSTLLMLSVLAIVVITGLRALADYASRIGFALIGNNVLMAARNDVFRHVQRLSQSFHTKAKSGDLQLRVMSDINMLKDVTVTAALPLVANVLALAGMFAMMLCLHWQLALLFLVMLPIFWFWTVLFSRRIQQASRKQRKREAAIAATAAEVIGGIQTVQALSLEDQFTDAFEHRNKQSQKQDVKSARLSAALGRTIGFLIAASTALVLWYGAHLVLNGELTPGDLLVFMAYLRNGFRPVQDFAKFTGRLAKATAAGERVLHLLEQTPEVADLPGAVPAPPFQGAVRFEEVTFAYDPGRSVLDRIDFEAKPGEHVAVVGPSGIGKSTLVNLLLRFYDPVWGRVLIDGKDIRDFTLSSLRAQVSVVLQDTFLFAGSVRDNIAFGAPGASPEAIEAASRLANAHDFILALPSGYDTVLGERGLTLSGGQRQRLAIARAAVRQAPILLLDEPVTGLDEESERAILEALDRVAQDRTTFFITHDLKLAAQADRILYLEHGEVLEQGSHAELIQASGRYAALYNLQRDGPSLPADESDALVDYGNSGIKDG